MEQLDGTVIATALPQMARSFGENPVNVGLGISAYLLTLAVFIPVSGWFADRFGARNVLGAAIVVFTVASVLCGFSGSLGQFVLARVLQGVGGAMMVPVGRLVVMRTSAKHEIVNAMSLITTPGLVATIVGPAVGGFITTYWTWRWIFFLNIPIGVAGLLLVLIFIPNERAAERRPFDLPGFILTGAGLASLMYGLDLIGRSRGSLPSALAFALAGAAGFTIAVIHATRTAHPMLNLAPMRLKTFATTTVWSGVLYRMVIGATPFLWPLMFQVGMAMTPFVSGLLVVACAVGDVGMKAFTSRLLRRFGFRTILLVNGTLVALLVTLSGSFPLGVPLTWIAVILLFVGVTRSMQFTALAALAFADVPAPLMSAASSLSSTFIQLSFGMGVAFAALTLQLAASLHGSAGAFSLGDFHFALAAAGLVALASTLICLRIHPQDGAEVSGHLAVSSSATR